MVQFQCIWDVYRIELYKSWLTLHTDMCHCRSRFTLTWRSWMIFTYWHVSLQESVHTHMTIVDDLYILTCVTAGVGSHSHDDRGWSTSVHWGGCCSYHEGSQTAEAQRPDTGGKHHSFTCLLINPCQRSEYWIYCAAYMRRLVNSSAVQSWKWQLVWASATVVQLMLVGPADLPVVVWLTLCLKKGPNFETV